MKYYKIYKNGVEMKEIWLAKMYDLEFGEMLAKAIDGFLDSFINTDFVYNDNDFSIRPADERIAAKIENADTYEEAYEIAQEYKVKILSELK